VQHLIKSVVTYIKSDLTVCAYFDTDTETDKNNGTSKTDCSYYFVPSSLCGLWLGHCFWEQRSGIVFRHRLDSCRHTNPPATPSRGHARWRAITPTDKNNGTSKTDCSYYFVPSSLCGLWLGHCFWEQRSGIVFVPSIIRALHMGQRFPVGRALMAFLHSG
jgi:hypothetical protein